MGVLLLIICYAWLVWLSLTIGKQARDLELFFASFVAQGVAIWLGVQSFFKHRCEYWFAAHQRFNFTLMSYGVIGDCDAGVYGIIVACGL